jgi:hypothetical protein
MDQQKHNISEQSETKDRPHWKSVKKFFHGDGKKRIGAKQHHNSKSAESVAVTDIKCKVLPDLILCGVAEKF